MVKINNYTYINEKYITEIKLYEEKDKAVLFFIGETEGTTFSYADGKKVLDALIEKEQSSETKNTNQI